jgi:GNAT superfamily N-acetyltransferase
MTQAELTISRGFQPDERRRAAELFWQAFAGKLTRVMSPTSKAQAFFARTLDPAFCLSARDARGQLLGLAGFKTDEGSFSGGGFRDLAVSYGWPGALWRGLVLASLERDVAPGILLMDGIFIVETARGIGAGSALLSAIKDEARGRGLSQVRLDVIDTNPRARALYERRGFVPLSSTNTGPLRWLFGFSTATTMVWTDPEAEK